MACPQATINFPGNAGAPSITAFFGSAHSGFAPADAVDLSRAELPPDVTHGREPRNQRQNHGYGFCEGRGG